MIVRYSPVFLAKLKKANVRIRKSFKEKILIFSKNPDDPELNNHTLREPLQDLKSIDITADYRAIYKEKHEGEEDIAYFEGFGTHEELYQHSQEN